VPDDFQVGKSFCFFGGDGCFKSTVFDGCTTAVIRLARLGGQASIVSTLYGTFGLYRSSSYFDTNGGCGALSDICDTAMRF